MDRCNIALVGCGEIARTQHARALEAVAKETGFALVATADPQRHLPGFLGRHYADHLALLEGEPDISAISVASPTSTHFVVARDAMRAGRHVLLEKPPTTTLSELLELRRIAEEQKVVLVTSFHARHNAAVEQAREILAGRPPQHVAIEWCEDFERWHGGQSWPWRPGGFGVFDPGINALSILCHILPRTDFRVAEARFQIPSNAATPAVVRMRLAWDGGAGDVHFEWRKGGQDIWDITLRSDFAGDRSETLLLRGVRSLLRDGVVINPGNPDEEYAGVYRNFRRSIASGRPEVSLREMQIIEEAMTVAEVEQSDASF